VYWRTEEVLIALATFPMPPAEGEQLRLLFRQGQSELRQALGECRGEALGILFQREEGNVIVRETDDFGRPSAAGAHDARKP
jgi:hypothetical protein